MKSRVLLFFFLVIATSAQAQSGASFLRIGVGARSAGMAEAYSAVTEDATAAYWNPAGLANIDRRQATFFHNEWFQDIRSEFFALVLPGRKKTIAFSFTSNSSGDIEIRGNQPTVEPTGTFAAHDLAFAVSYSSGLKERLDFGATFKYLYQKIFTEESSGFAGDIGLRYHIQNAPLVVAAVVQNIGALSKLRDESPRLPTLLRLGVVYRPAASGTPKWTAAADWVAEFDGKSHLHMGGEVMIGKNLALRSGYQTGYDLKNVHFGIGLVLQKFLLDYGYVPLRHDFGQGHRFSITYIF